MKRRSLVIRSAATFGVAILVLALWLTSRSEQSVVSKEAEPSTRLAMLYSITAHARAPACNPANTTCVSTFSCVVPAFRAIYTGAYLPKSFVLMIDTPEMHVEYTDVGRNEVVDGVRVGLTVQGMDALGEAKARSDMDALRAKFADDEKHHFPLATAAYVKAIKTYEQCVDYAFAHPGSQPS